MGARSMTAHFEAKKHAYRQTQDGIVVSFVVHPSDVSSDLATAALGTRYMVAFAEITDTPQQAPAERSEAAHSPRKFSELPLVRQVGIRCSDVLFQDYLGCETELEVIEIVRAKCAVSSRKDIIEGSPAGAIWHQIERQYQSWLTDRQFSEAKR